VQLDVLIDNARVRTMDGTRPHARSIGVLHERIVTLDDDAGLRAREHVDLGGRTVLPGFVDAHNHLAWAGLAARSLDLTGATRIDDALDRIAGAVAQTPAGTWVDVVGYDQRPLGRHLRRDDLDRVSDGRRVYLIHRSGHAHLVNSAVLADLPADFGPHSDPGVVVDENLVPTGLFLEEATRFVNAVRTPYAVAELTEAIAVAGRICAAQGVTFVAEAGVGGGLTARSPLEVLAYQDAIDSGQFRLRAQLMVSVDMITAASTHPDDGISRAFPLGMRTGFGSDRLGLGAVKAWLDGGMSSRTAALTEPYVLDGEPQAGDLALNLDDIAEAACAAHAAGWQLALHAIGDRAIDAAIDIIDTAQRRHPRENARHRIEHCGLARPDQLPRLAALQITAVTQPAFLHAFGDDYATIMGPERADWLYRGQTYLDAGIAIAGSSDRPVADGAPLRGIQFLVDRRSRTSSTIGADEAISLDDAVHAYTMGSARACRVDDRVGSISAGKYADLVVLDADPWDIQTEQLAEIPIVCTVVGGEVVHGEWPA
jgi:predicted amidohydrolase YtcJ